MNRASSLPEDMLSTQTRRGRGGRSHISREACSSAQGAGAGNTGPAIGRAIPLLLLVGVIAALLSGCQTPRPSAADTGPSQAIVGADISISTARYTFDTFHRWERENRAILAGTPEVRHYADLVRDRADEWLKDASACRNAYAANPTPENLGKLQTSLTALDASASQVETILAENTWKVLPYLKEPIP